MTDPSKLPYARIARELLEEPAAPSPSTPTVVAPEPGDSQPSLPLQMTDTASPPTARGETRVLWRPEVPRKLGPYDLLEEIGHGGMGIVYRARHEALGTLCAVKVLIAGEHASPESLGRFYREASAVARMGRHPNIVTVYDLGREGAITYYAMELVDGKPLRSRVQEGPLPPEEAASIAQKVARALHVAHQHGIIHRDIKPENILLRDDGEPCVLDFGLAHDIDSTVHFSVTGQVMGTPQYMAPEQLRGAHAECDARTDVYGVGGVLYEMLTRLPPHPGKALADIAKHILLGEVIAPRRLAPNVPKDLEAICMKCLAPEAPQRYQTAEALAEDLGHLLRGEPVTATRLTIAYWTRKKLHRHRRVLAVTLALLLLAIGARQGYVAWARLREQARARDHLRLAREAWDSVEHDLETEGAYPKTPQTRPRVVDGLKSVVSHCDEALRIDPGLVEANALRGPAQNYLSGVRGTLGAMMVYSDLISKNPTDGPLHHGRARAMMQFLTPGNIPEAIEVMKEDVEACLRTESSDFVLMKGMQDWLEAIRAKYPEHAAKCDETLRWLEEKRQEAH